MSKNRRRNAPAKPVTPAEEPLVARVVAIPKEPEPPVIEQEPEPVIVFQEPEPKLEPPPMPKREPVVVLQEPKPEPKAAKPKAKAERIGDMLREARLERNDDLYQIAEYLCIKPAFLIALENSHYDEFPADAYVIGFLRTYANFLGVDGKEAVDRYRYEMAGRRKKPVLSMPTPVSEGRAPSGIIMVGAAVVLLMIYALWYGFSSANRTTAHLPPPLPTATQQVPVVTPADSSAAAGLTAPVSSSAPTPAPAATAPATTTPATTTLAVTPQSTTTPVSSATPAAPATAATTVVIPPAAPGIVLSGDLPAATKDDAAEKAAALEAKAAAKAAKAAAKEQAEAAKAAAKEAAAKEQAEAEKKLAASDSEKKPAANDPASNSRVTIRATQSSWIMIIDDSGKALYDHVLKPGESYKVPNKPGLLLTTGNGSGIVLSLDGTELPKVAVGAPHVVRNIALDPDRLAALPAATEH